MGFRICIYVRVCVVRYWAILLCGRSWLVTQGGWVVVVRVAITEQVLNYPPDVRCGGAAMFVWGGVGWGGCLSVHLGEDRVPFHMWSAQWPCVARSPMWR